MLGLQIRVMIRADITQCLEVENRSFPDSPWSEKEFKRRLTNQHTLGLVAESKQIVGFCMFELHKDCLYLTTIAVEPTARRLKVGKRLMEAAVSHLAGVGRDVFLLDVRERNLTAQQLFRACGFKAKKVIPNFFPDTGESSYRMEYRR